MRSGGCGLPEAEAEARRVFGTEQSRRWFRVNPDGVDAVAAAAKAACATRKRAAEYLLTVRLEQPRERTANRSERGAAAPWSARLTEMAARPLGGETAGPVIACPGHTALAVHSNTRVNCLCRRALSCSETPDSLHPLVKISDLEDGLNTQLRAVRALWRIERAIQGPLCLHTGEEVKFRTSREGVPPARLQGISSSLRCRPAGACNSKHRHMSSWSCHSHWCIGGTYERRGVSQQGEGTSKGLDHLPVGAGRSSCCRLVQRLEEASWPVAGPWSPFADRTRGQLAGSHEPVLAGSRLAGRDPALLWQQTMYPTPLIQWGDMRQAISVAAPSTVARSPHARG